MFCDSSMTRVTKSRLAKIPWVREDLLYHWPTPEYITKALTGGEEQTIDSNQMGQMDDMFSKLFGGMFGGMNPGEEGENPTEDEEVDEEEDEEEANIDSSESGLMYKSDEDEEQTDEEVNDDDKYNMGILNCSPKEYERLKSIIKDVDEHPEKLKEHDLVEVEDEDVETEESENN